MYIFWLEQSKNTARDRVHVQNDCLVVVPYECHLDFSRWFLISNTGLTGFMYLGRVTFPSTPPVSSGNKVYLGHTAPGSPPSCTTTHRIREFCYNLDAGRWRVMSNLGLLWFLLTLETFFKKKNDFLRVTLVVGEDLSWIISPCPYSLVVDILLLPYDPIRDWFQAFDLCTYLSLHIFYYR